MKLECVNNIIVDTSECLKPCSGLIVSSFSKHNPHPNEIMENLHRNNNFLEYHVLEGVHHQHLNNSKQVFDFILSFLNKVPSKL